MVVYVQNPLRSFFREMEDLHRQYDRIFDQVGIGHRGKPNSAASFLPGRGARVYPLVNVSEDDSALFVEALAPGIDAQSLDVSIKGNQLTISGSKPAPAGEVKPECYHRSERAAGRFVRTVELQTEVDAEKIEAEYADGLLKIRLPKSEKAKPRQITVKTS